jgi:hypothetical protein
MKMGNRGGLWMGCDGMHTRKLPYPTTTVLNNNLRRVVT